MDKTEYEPVRHGGYPFHVFFDTSGVKVATLFSWLDKNTNGWCLQYPYVYFADEADAVRFSLTYGDGNEHRTYNW